jgi:uncharacterized membrane protein
MTDRPRALIVLIAVFLLGGIVGTGGTYLWMKKSPAPERVEMPGRRPGPSQGRPRMQELLQLTPEQESQFGKIMAESRRQMEALRAEQQPKIEAVLSERQPKMEAIIADTNRKVMAILNKDQQKKFESMWKEMNSRGRRPSRGGHGMGPQPPR